MFNRLRITLTKKIVNNGRFDLMTHVENGKLYFFGERFTLCEAIKMKINEMICKYRGHKIVDESYGGPETGYFDAHCTRCGVIWHETLY